MAQLSPRGSGGPHGAWRGLGTSRLAGPDRAGGGTVGRWRAQNAATDRPPRHARPSPSGHQLPSHAWQRKPAVPLKGGDSWLGPLFPSSQAVSGPPGHQSLRVHFLRGPHRAAEPGAPLGKQGQEGREAEGPVPGWQKPRAGTNAPLAPGSQPPHLRNGPAVPGSTCVPRGRGHTALAPAAPPDSVPSLAPSFWGLLHGTSSQTPSLTALPSVCPLCE